MKSGILQGERKFHHPPRVVSFGEILFDVIEGVPCLGGAPLNLAVHLHRQGAETTLISAVGADPARSVGPETDSGVRTGYGEHCGSGEVPDRNGDGFAG